MVYLILQNFVVQSINNQAINLCKGEIWFLYKFERNGSKYTLTKMYSSEYSTWKYLKFKSETNSEKEEFLYSVPSNFSISSQAKDNFLNNSVCIQKIDPTVHMVICPNCEGGKFYDGNCTKCKGKNKVSLASYIRFRMHNP